MRVEPSLMHPEGGSWTGVRTHTPSKLSKVQRTFVSHPLGLLQVSGERITAPSDLDARYSLQHGSAWVGYKAHATETCDDDTPHVITHVETTPATTPPDTMLEPIHAALAEQALLPRDHLVDCGYTDAEILVESAQDYGVHIVGPVAADPSWQARERTGYDQSAFTIDWEAHTATCPHGKR